MERLKSLDCPFFPICPSIFLSVRGGSMFDTINLKVSTQSLDNWDSTRSDPVLLTMEIQRAPY